MADELVSWRSAGDGIRVLVLRRPPANALGRPLIDGLNAALDEVERSGGVKVVVVASEIPGFFAAGADIKQMSTADTEEFAAYGEALRTTVNRLATPDRITIAAVDGLALGGGLELAMACTLRVAGPDAKFGLPEVRLGLIPGAGGTQRLPRLVGRGRALDIMLTARQVPADEAHAIGLVDRLAAGSAEQAALELAAELVGMSLPAQSAVIRSVDAAYDLLVADGHAYEAAQEQDLFAFGEAREGISAFLAKRPPKFA
ncbi:MAG TPA: enoyl-CoA hydratase-related protein [Pseudonocardiaceae bacterium]|jgi:enoyl-CoA hydratase|nr:enoyl-CoA hydratase-related protein [Pseudonocardiaceae bacterium]